MFIFRIQKWSENPSFLSALIPAIYWHLRFNLVDTVAYLNVIIIIIIIIIMVFPGSAVAVVGAVSRSVIH